MRFKHRTTGEIVTIKTGNQEHVWFHKDNDPILYLLEATQFFNKYESIKKDN